MSNATPTGASSIAGSRILKPEGVGRAIWKQSSSGRPSSAAWARTRRCWRSYEGDPVLVEQGRHMVATFHPELTADSSVHEMFLDKIEKDA